MIDFIFQIVLSNSCVAVVLATAAMLITLFTKRPHLAHLLWIFVLVKLVTPPIYNVQIPFPTALSATQTSEPDRELENGFTQKLATSTSIGIGSKEQAFDSDDHRDDQKQLDSQLSVLPSNSVSNFAAIWQVCRPWLVLVWSAGTLVILFWSLIQVLRFHNLLMRTTQPAGKKVLLVVDHLRDKIGLKHSPTILTTTARICPMVWWTGGKVNVVMPESMFDELDHQQWKLVLAHELAHIHRRDHLVRWLEWLACVCFWWNPIFWLAQRNLRAAEEVCCDELVISSLNPSSYSYANSILKAVESLVGSAIRPPAMASEINSGGFLKRRIEMILNGSPVQKNSHLMRYCVAAFALILIPFGVVQAQDFDAIKRRLNKAVKHNEITFEQAAIMMEALHRSREHDEHEHRHDDDHQHGDHEHDDHEHGEHKHDDREHDDREHDEHDEQIEMRERAEHLRQREREEREEIELDRRRELELHRQELANERIELLREKKQVELLHREMEKRRHEALHEIAKLDVLANDREGEFQTIANNLEQAYEAGKITRKQFQEKMNSIRKELWNQEHRPSENKKQNAESERRSKAEDKKLEAKYLQAIKKIEQAIKAGKIKKEDAKKMIDEYRYKLWPEAKQKEENRRRVEFEKATEAISNAVKSGKMTKRQGAERIERFKKQLWGEQKKKETSPEEPNRKSEKRDPKSILKAVETDMRAALDAGKINRKQYTERIEELKKRLFPDKAGE